MPALLAALVPYLMIALRVFLLANLVGLAVRLIAALGLYFFVMQPVGQAVEDMILGRLGGMPAEAAAWFGFLQVDVYLGFILSAQTIVWASNFVMRYRSST